METVVCGCFTFIKSGNYLLSKECQQTRCYEVDNAHNAVHKISLKFALDHDRRRVRGQHDGQREASTGMANRAEYISRVRSSTQV